MIPVLVARLASCLLLLGNFAYLTYACVVIRNPYGITVGVTGLLTTLCIAWMFYYDHRLIRRLLQQNKLLKGQVVETRVALLKQWEQNQQEHH